MKKIFVSTFAVLAMLAMPQQVEAQAFLNKVKEKAQQAAQQAASKIGVPATSTSSATGSSSSSNSASIAVAEESYAADYSDERTPLKINQDASDLQRRQNRVGGWDQSLVTPSTAKFPIPLMNELPAVPSAAEIANPTEEGQKAFYMAIQKVSLRANALVEDETCNQEQEAFYQKKIKDQMMKAYGLNEREYAIFSGEIQASEAEQQKVLEKVMGFNMEDLMSAFGDVENMSEAEREAKAREMAGDMLSSSTSATAKVFNKYAAELKKYTGKTAAETNQMMETQTQLAMQGKEKEAEAMSKKFEAEVKAFQKNLSAADQKAAKEFENKMQKEVQEAMKAGFRSGNPMGQMLAGMEEARKKEAKAMEFKNKMDKYNDALSKAFNAGSLQRDSKDYAFAAAELKKLENLRSQIFATDDPAKYNPLFVQIDEIIKSYRQRAAEVWRADVQKRIDDIKASLPNLIKVNRQAVEDQLIPECMLYRAPLNMVLNACEVLENAYSEVPVSYPTLYQAEVVRQVKLTNEEQIWWPEFYVSQSVEDILAGRTIFKSSKGHVYKFDSGKWVNVDNVKTDEKNIDGKARMKSQKWTSADGKRTVSYVEEGGYFTLPEGDVIYPRAMVKQGNNIVWVDTVEENDKQDNTIVKIVKYIYKL